MPTPQELETKLWKSLKSDMTVMLGTDAHMRPMTAQIEGEHGPIFLFTSKDTNFGKITGEKDAHIAFASKGHDIFATIHGKLTLDNDRAQIERLWNPFVAAWFKGGKDDPQIALLRFEPSEAVIWENANSLLAGIKLALGSDPKEDYRDKVAKVAMR